MLDSLTRSDDLFFGAKPGDIQPDWVNLDKVAIPQADEQQRLLADLVTGMNADRMPLPRFWYLPRGEKAAVVMTGDDHANATGPPASSRGFKADSPAGCSVANWECIRATSYVFPGTSIPDAEALRERRVRDRAAPARRVPEQLHAGVAPRQLGRAAAGVGVQRSRR